MIWVQNQLELAALGQNISLQCTTESYPSAIHYWTYQNGTVISAGIQSKTKRFSSRYIQFGFAVFSVPGKRNKYRLKKETEKLQTKSILHILDVEKSDFGTYFCVAKNSLGEQDGAIKLSGIFSGFFLRHSIR